jgi:hypothetical protein
MPDPISGRETIFGLKKASAWGTPVAAGANDGTLLLSSGMGREYAVLEDRSLGGAWELNPERGPLTAGGDLPGFLRYDNAEWVAIAQLLGTAGVPAQQGATLAYLHTLQLADGIAGKFFTFVQKMKSDEVWEFPSVKPVSLRLKFGKRQAMEVTIGTVASHLNRNAGSGTNNTTTIATITSRETLRRIVMDAAAYIRINDQSAGALAAGDNHPIGTGELMFTRPQEGDNVLDGNEFITQPVGTDFAPAELTVTFPVYEDKADVLLDGLEADTLKKIELFAQGPILDATERYRITIQMPQAQVVGRPEIALAGPGKIAATLRFKLTKASAAPAGMAGVTNPFAIKVVNKRTTDFLA